LKFKEANISLHLVQRQDVSVVNRIFINKISDDEGSNKNGDDDDQSDEEYPDRVENAEIVAGEEFNKNGMTIIHEAEEKKENDDLQNSYSEDEYGDDEEYGEDDQLESEEGSYSS
jgi:hypothetical protein